MFPKPAPWYLSGTEENGITLSQMEKTTVVVLYNTVYFLTYETLGPHSGWWILISRAYGVSRRTVRINTNVLEEPAVSIVYNKNGDSRSVRNVGTYLSNYTSHPNRAPSSHLSRSRYFRHRDKRHMTFPYLSTLVLKKPEDFGVVKVHILFFWVMPHCSFIFTYVVLFSVHTEI